MKILQIVHNFPPEQLGGVEVFSYHFSKELSRHHEVHVFYPKITKSRFDSIVSFKMDNLIIHQLNVPDKFHLPQPCAKLKHLIFGINFSLGLNRKYEKEFKKFLNQLKPDIIHFQHLIGLSFYFPIIAKNFAPVILTIHDYWLICPTTHFLNQDNKICYSSSVKNCTLCLSKSYKEPMTKTVRKYKCSFFKNFFLDLLGKYMSKKLKKRNIAIKIMLSKIDWIITTSNSVMKKLIENSFITPSMLKNNKAVILEYGINTSKLLKINKKPSDKIRFGFIGSMAERKGLHVLIEAFNMLHSSKAILYIYSWGNVKPLIDKSKNNSDIRFMGSFLDNVSEPYSKIDVLIVPSITYEGYGLVVLEAFAAKIPIIASNIPALNEFVKNNQNGLLFNTGDINDLCKKMKMIIDNPDLIERFKLNIPSVKSIEQYTQECEIIYQKCLKTK